MKMLTYFEMQGMDLCQVEFDMQLVLKVARDRDSDSLKPLKPKMETLYLWPADMAFAFVSVRRKFALSGLGEEIKNRHKRNMAMATALIIKRTYKNIN